MVRLLAQYGQKSIGRCLAGWLTTAKFWTLGGKNDFMVDHVPPAVATVAGRRAARSGSQERQASGKMLTLQLIFPAYTPPHTITTMSTEVDVRNGTDGQSNNEKTYPQGMHPRLRYLQPYWWPYRTFVKQR